MSCRRRRLRRHSRRRSHGRTDGARRSLTGRRGRTRRRHGLCRPLRDRLQYIAGFGDVRQVDLGLELVGCRGCTRASAGAGLMLRKILLNALRFVHFNRTGVRFLLGYADLDQNVEDRLALYLELSCQVVNSNLVLHSALFPPSLCPPRLRLHSILTVWFVYGPQRQLRTVLY
jgi:hypothetical protein